MNLLRSLLFPLCLLPVLSMNTLAADSELDTARVRQVVLAIPTAIDVLDFTAAVRLFAPEVLVDYTSLWGGEPQRMTGSALVASWQGLVPGFDGTWHEISGIEVTMGPGPDEASAKCVVDARHWLGGAQWRVAGRYLFELQRIDGRWRVRAMTLIAERESGERKLVEQASVRAAAGARP